MAITQTNDDSFTSESVLPPIGSVESAPIAASFFLLAEVYDGGWGWEEGVETLVPIPAAIAQWMALPVYDIKEQPNPG
jgi:hypothetical protein